jgi:formylglycine-generating enzyme required for sulfatase activity
VIRLLVKAFQYELQFSPADFAEMKKIVHEFDGNKISNSNALRRIHDTAKKLVMHAVNIEYAINKLDELGLRQKLIAMGDISEINSDAWWLNRKPLRSSVVGSGKGVTAAELKLKIVAHETNNFLAFESITRAHSGEPNVFVSRESVIGETAAFGEGFYTRIGKEGARGSGFTVRFMVNPKARLGTDFIMEGDYIIFKNKKALTVIQESLNFGIDELFKLVESNEEFQVHQSDLALLEKLKRKMNATLINDEINKLLSSKLERDHERLVHILNSFQNSSIEKLISSDVLVAVAKNVFGRVANLAKSQNDDDQIRYIKAIGSILKILDSNGVLKQNSFFNYLEKLIKTPTLNFNLRQQAVFELLLSSGENFEQHLNFKNDMRLDELKVLASEISEWSKAHDPRKRKFAARLNKTWSESIENGDVKRLKALKEYQFFDINHKNISQLSVLQLAAYYKHKKIINWLIKNPDFNFNAKNSVGQNEVEQLRLSGKGEFADYILQKRPDIQAQKFSVQERNTDQKTNEYPNGTPIVDFVRFEAGTFMMGDRDYKVLTTISKPFEIMSVDITQKTYRIIVELLKQNLKGSDYSELYPTPSFFKSENRPVEHTTYEEISLWKKGLNELSKLNDTKIQQTLKDLFPGHKQGSEYNRPTEAQWEYVSRLGGVAESDYAHGKGDAELDDYAFYSQNSYSNTQVVGLKKPVFYNGKPIYDLHGNVWKWVEDWYDSSLIGGIDPQGPIVGSNRVIRGGSWNGMARVLCSASRISLSPADHGNNLGFRIVRSSL